MSAQFLHEDGQGNIVDENGKPEPMDYIYLQKKPAEKSRANAMQVDKPRDEDYYKARFFKLKIEKCMSASAAAKQLGIHVRTAQRWVKQYEEHLDSIFDSIFDSGRKKGRRRILTEEHVKAVIDFIDANPSAVVTEVAEHLMQQFDGLKVNHRTVYNFMGTEYSYSVKQAEFQSVERNSPEKIEERHDWVRKWEQTDMDFLTNCVFLHESAFHINMKRTRAWSKKSTPAVVTVPTTRAKTTTMLGAISASSLIKVSLRIPKPVKKRKAEQESGYVSAGTVTGHYISFLEDTLDEMDKYPQMKGHYLVMDNAPIHKSDDIAKYITSRGYRCAYLPSYSPELNPIEQFWSVAKSKVKRHRFLEKETLSTRISEACNSIMLSDFHGFVSHSHNCWDKCRNRETM
ncbi:hypothetical protein VTP01DRAFT_7894 [Rhizomucor pusillus]|uniref:uncharacterized protein n=1 Tax=Rhizomucor pusillus TaxID=4840 RepID=UPI00374322BB